MRPQLAPWVEVQVERCRGGRALALALNRRDGRLLRLSSDDHAFVVGLDGTKTIDDLVPTPAQAHLLDELDREGFFATSTPLPVTKSRSRLASFLTTLDVNSPRADRLVRRLYRGGLRHAFHPVALAAQLVLALAGAAALFGTVAAGHHLQLRVQPGAVVLLLAINAAAIFVHELAHGLVLVHYGRSVHSAGFRLHLGAPAFYVETLDGRFLSRRQRMLQAAAGPWAEWLVTSVFAIALWGSPSALLAPLLYRFVILNSVTVVSNLLPFIGLDGYWLLADVVREPELAERSRAAWKRVIRSLMARRRPAGDETVLATYATANAGVAAVMLGFGLFVWYEFFGDLVAHLVDAGPFGWVVLGAAGTLLLRPSLIALRHHVGQAVAYVGLGVSRLRFRAERTWRIAEMERLASQPELAGLDDSALSVLAGQLERVRRGRHKVVVLRADVLDAVRRGVLTAAPE